MDLKRSPLPLRGAARRGCIITRTTHVMIIKSINFGLIGHVADATVAAPV